MIAVARRAGPSAYGSAASLGSAGSKTHTTLRTAPRPSKGSLVDVELGLSETASAYGTAGVVDLLNDRLGGSEVVDKATKRVVLAANELVDERLERERRVSGPSIEVVRVDSARASDDNARLAPGVISMSIADPSNTRHTLAPEESDPSGPMLASTPASRGESRSRCRRSHSTGRKRRRRGQGRTRVRGASC